MWAAVARADVGCDTAYFDVDFAGPTVAKPTTFTTGPHGTPTHWKQTLLYRVEPLAVVKGATIEGTLRVVKNKGNPRAVDVRVTFAVDGGVSHSQLFHLH